MRATGNTHALTLALFLSVGCSSVKLSEEFETSLGTAYPLRERVIGDYDMSVLTEAPLRALVIAEIDLPREEAFALMLTGIHEWFPGVKEFAWTDTDNGRIVAGSVRTGDYKGSTMVEPVRYIDPGYAYVYQIDLEATGKFIPITEHTGVFTVEALSDTSSLIVWRQYFRNCIPLTGRLIAWVMEDRIAEPAFDNLVGIHGGRRIDHD